MQKIAVASLAILFLILPCIAQGQQDQIDKYGLKKFMDQLILVDGHGFYTPNVIEITNADCAYVFENNTTRVSAFDNETEAYWHYFWGCAILHEFSLLGVRIEIIDGIPMFVAETNTGIDGKLNKSYTSSFVAIYLKNGSVIIDSLWLNTYVLPAPEEIIAVRAFRDTSATLEEMKGVTAGILDSIKKKWQIIDGTKNHQMVIPPAFVESQAWDFEHEKLILKMRINRSLFKDSLIDFKIIGWRDRKEVINTTDTPRKLPASAEISLILNRADEVSYWGGKPGEQFQGYFNITDCYARFNMQDARQ